MTAAETALRTYLENHTEDCSINLAEEYAHGHIAFCIRGGLALIPGEDDFIVIKRADS